MPNLYSKGWKDSNNVIRYYKDEDARNILAILTASVSTEGSIDYKIAQAVGDLSGFEVVESIPVQNPNTKTIYLVKDTSVTGVDKYKEYIWNSTDGYILIGDTSIDLSNYVINTTKASTSSLGLVKVDGSTITVDSDGTIHGANTPPTATNSSLGVVKGDGVNIDVDNNGLLTALKVNGHTVNSDVPSNAVFTDTTDYTQLTNKPTLGTAAAKDTVATLTSGGTNVPTDGAVYTAVNSVITSTTTDPGEGSTLQTGHLLIVLEED